MGKHNDLGQHQVATTLGAIGYSVELLAERATPTCDLRATHDTGTLLVEVKTLLPSDEERRQLAAHQYVEMKRDVTRASGLHSRLHRGAKQLKSTTEAEAVHILWTRVFGAGQDSRSLQLLCTMYGIKWFAIDGMATPCFLADRSWFRTHPDVCAQVAETPSGIAIRVNPFGDASLLQRTRLFDVLARLGGVFDMRAHAAALGIVIADLGVAAPAVSDVLVHLREKSRATVVEMQPGSYQAWSRTQPGSEMGGTPIVPGADIEVSNLNLALIMEQIRGTGR